MDLSPHRSRLCFNLYSDPTGGLNDLSPPLLQRACAEVGSSNSPGSAIGYLRRLSCKLACYLRVDQPISAIWSGTKNKVVGSSYVAEKRPHPAAGYGKTLFTHGEFKTLLDHSDRPLFVFVHDKDLHRLEAELVSAKRILQVGDVTLIRNDPIP